MSIDAVKIFCIEFMPELRARANITSHFGIEKYSTVSSIVERVKYEMNADKGIKKQIQNLAEIINKSQRQT